MHANCHFNVYDVVASKSTQQDGVFDRFGYEANSKELLIVALLRS
jgi:hypothetical protein